MRQVTITMSLPWSRQPYATSLYGRTAIEIQSLITRQIRRYAGRSGVAPCVVDYEVSWGAAR